MQKNFAVKKRVSWSIIAKNQQKSGALARHEQPPKLQMDMPSFVPLETNQ